MATTRPAPTLPAPRPPHGDRPAALGLLAVHPHDHAHWVALRTVVSVGAPLLAVMLAGRADLTPAVSFAAFAAIFGRNSTYPARLALQLRAGVLLVTAAVLGTVIAAPAPASVWAVLGTALAAGLAHVLTRRWGLQPHAALFVAFAFGTLSAHPRPWIDVAWTAVLGLASVALSVAVGQSGRLFRRGRERPKAERPPVRPWRQVVARAAWADTACFVAAPAIAGLVAMAIGGAHPQWAMVAAVVPLSGLTRYHRFSRVTHRALGSLAGAGVTFLLLALHPSPWAALGVVLVCQAWAELFVLRHYAWAVLGITPMAALMAQLATPLDATSTALDRVVETGLGLAAAVVLILPWSRLVRRRARS